MKLSSFKSVVTLLFLAKRAAAVPQLCGNSVNCEVLCQQGAYHVENGHFACTVDEPVRYAAYYLSLQPPTPTNVYNDFTRTCMDASGMRCTSSRGTSCVVTQDDAAIFTYLLSGGYQTMFQNLNDYNSVLSQACMGRRP